MHAQETPVLWYDSLDSTNAEASRLIEAGSLAQCWVVAREQTRGRGRANRSWTSPHGNFMGTRLWPAGRDLRSVSMLSLAVGQVVRDLIAGFHDAPNSVRTKWPNDVYIGHAKICGILIETHRADDGQFWAAIGIGVNLAQAPFVADGRTSSSLATVNAMPTPDAFLKKLEPALSLVLNAWPPNSTEKFCADWVHTAFGIGETVVLSGGETGSFDGIQRDGAARVLLDSGRQTSVHAGDLVFTVLEKARNAASD